VRDEFSKRFDDFGLLGKTAHGKLGKDDAAVGGHIENTAAAADQVDGEIQFLFDRAGQTGRPRFVVSFTAVGDGDLHPLSPFGRLCPNSRRTPRAQSSPGRHAVYRVKNYLIQ